MRKTILILILAVVMLLPAAVFAAGGDPLQLTYSGGTGGGSSNSDFPENTWTYRYQYHVLTLSGDVPQGRMFSMIQLEERDYISGLSYAKLSLSGSTYSIDLGDNTANFSDITLTSLSYQGAGITLKPYSNFSLTVVGGSRGNGLWGADVRRDTRPKENFTGIKSVYSPGWGLDLSTTYLTTPGGAQVFAYGSDYTFNDFKLGAEYGSATEGKAFRGEVKYQSGWLTLGTIYRDVESTYIVPFDYVGYKGMKGTYSSLGIRPFNNLTINVQSDSYIDRLNGDPELPNMDTRGDISCNFDTGTNIGYSGYRYNRPSYDRGGITDGEIMYITQQFYLLTKNAIYYRVQPTLFESFNSSEESYSENKNIAGITITLFDYAHLNYEVENASRLFQNTDIKLNPSAITARLDVFEVQIMTTPYYLASSINYRKEMIEKSGTEESGAQDETTTLYSDLTLKYVPNQDLSCYITGKVYDINSPDADRTARQQVDMNFGLKYSFNTNIFLK